MALIERRRWAMLSPDDGGEAAAQEEAAAQDSSITTKCCIGGGPAGMMLGFLLARAGVDFLRAASRPGWLASASGPSTSTRPTRRLTRRDA
jgi:hypothetical protein